MVTLRAIKILSVYNNDPLDAQLKSYCSCKPCFKDVILTKQIPIESVDDIQDVLSLSACAIQ